MIVPGPYQLRKSPSASRITAHSPIRPSPRAAFTLQQFSSGEPGRHWKSISWKFALRTPSIGVLYVLHRPLGAHIPSAEFSVESSSSSATIDSPVIASISTLIAIQAIVQQVSIAPRW